MSSGIFGGSRQEVLEYDGTTGQFLRVFASQNLTSPRGLLFGPDGNLYVANRNDDSSVDPASVERFDGRTGAVANSALRDGVVPIAGTSGVLCYDAATGAFLNTFVAPDGGLRFATFLTFTETNPTTLNYNGSQRRSTAVFTLNTVDANLNSGQAQPVPAEIPHRQPTAGVDSPALQGSKTRSTKPGSPTHGLGLCNPAPPGGNAVRRFGDDHIRWVWHFEKSLGHDLEFGRPDSLE